MNSRNAGGLAPTACMDKDFDGVTRAKKANQPRADRYRVVGCAGAARFGALPSVPKYVLMGSVYHEAIAIVYRPNGKVEAWLPFYTAGGVVVRLGADAPIYIKGGGKPYTKPTLPWPEPPWMGAPEYKLVCTACNREAHVTDKALWVRTDYCAACGMGALVPVQEERASYPARPTHARLGYGWNTAATWALTPNGRQLRMFHLAALLGANLSRKPH